MQWSGSIVEIGTGVVERRGDHLRLTIPSATEAAYADAQVDDVGERPRRRFVWRPPVRLDLRARFSHRADRLRGTAGFGFWNVPFGPGVNRVPALPRAVWFFFGAPPHCLPLAQGVPGHGWKAACLDAGRLPALPWAPLAPAAILAMRSRPVYQRLWPRIQRALAINEATISADMRPWHSYRLDWLPDRIELSVDGQSILSSPIGPRGPLAFVAWIDNQYAVATPWGRFDWGVVGITEPQWLELSDLSINRVY